MNIFPLVRLGLAVACLAMSMRAGAAPREVRGTWLTTTANSALRSPADTADSMRRLKEIGMNTVYVETWKNGYTQFPSDVLERTIGKRQRPVPQPQDPSDSLAQRQAAPRDLLQESLIEAHRNGMVYVAWFEYGFMAAYKETMNDLRTQKPGWLSRDKQGGEVAPNGFVWLNPLHPEARQFLLDLVLEAVDKYDVDGIQLDDRIVWPHITMGYDDYTQQVYAAEHGGKRPPQDHTDPEWMRWRADKVNEFSKIFVQEIRARRPGMLISLSPAIHPWAWEHYLLEWPVWSAWSARDRLQSASFKHAASAATTPRWDEFIPQAYRFSYADFEKTWLTQVEAMRTLGGNRQRDLVAGIRIVGDGVDSSWDQLRSSIELTRKLGNGGHVLWFSRGVLDMYARELTAFYKSSGPAHSPRFGPSWRRPALALVQAPGARAASVQRWRVPRLGAARHRAIGHDGVKWDYLDTTVRSGRALSVPARYARVELLLDRRVDMDFVPKQYE